MTHWHGYAWLGPAVEMDLEAPRRPGLAPIEPGNAAVFAASEVPPLELAHWLLRPPQQVKATFTDPDAAADWLRDQVLPHLAAMASPREADPVRLERVRARAARTLRAGGSEAFGHYLTGARFLSVSAIACGPNPFRPELPCPAPPPG